MSDLDRFAEFLRREGAGYNRPPETPADSLWPGVEARLTGSTAEQPLDALGYHEPPPAPREAMWERIEAAWALRRSADLAAGEAGLLPGGRGAVPRPSIGRRRVVVAGWVVSLAAAASLVLGLALGRDVPATDPGESAVATVSPQTALITEPAPVALDEDESLAIVPPVPDEERPGVEIARPNHRESMVRYAESRHLGRAATLLTAFRTDMAGPESQRELARWAGELLGDTRLLLDMRLSRSPYERALLQDLELVLVQIARLGPGAPDFERELIREGMESQGTLMRLRLADATGGST